MKWGSFEYASRFAPDICGMLSLKESLGHKPSSFAAGLLCFDRFCARTCPDEGVLTQEVAFAWCLDGKKEEMSEYRMHAIREFGKYLAGAGREAYVLPAHLIPKHKAGLPYLLTDGELEAFFKAADNYPHRRNSPLVEYTVPVIFRLIYACGMRPQEARKLKRGDFDYRKNVIYIEESKWCKDRRLVVDGAIMDMCGKYDSIASAGFPSRKAFFPNRSGGFYAHGWLTETFHKCWELSGVGNARGSCVPYDLRHNFATRTLMRWVSEGKDLETYIPYLCAYMGHATFRSTYYYVHLLPEKLAAMDFMAASGMIPEVPHEY